MRFWIGEHLMFVLAVELDQPLGQLAERGRCCQRAIDERAASALRGDLATYDDLATLALELRFDFCHLGTGSHQIARGASTKQEPDRLDEDRLAGPGLAGQHVEAGVRTRPRPTRSRRDCGC